LRETIKGMKMAETGKRLTTIEAVVRQYQAIEIKLNEARAELDELDIKQWRAEVEFARLRQNGLWGWLFAATQRAIGGRGAATNGLDLYSKLGLPRFGYQQK
jgi:hypothetical protein